MSQLAVRGVQVFVDARGPVDAPPLLFIHGGPGQGAYDFMSCQGELLSQRIRLLGLDQRGVLRSDPLPPDTALSELDLIDDFEALRNALGFDQ